MIASRRHRFVASAEQTGDRGVGDLGGDVPGRQVDDRQRSQPDAGRSGRQGCGATRCGTGARRSAGSWPTYTGAIVLRICSATAPSRVSVKAQPTCPVAVRDAHHGVLAVTHDPVAEHDRCGKRTLDRGDADVGDRRVARLTAVPPCGRTYGDGASFSQAFDLRRADSRSTTELLDGRIVQRHTADAEPTAAEVPAAEVRHDQQASGRRRRTRRSSGRRSSCRGDRQAITRQPVVGVPSVDDVGPVAGDDQTAVVGDRHAVGDGEAQLAQHGPFAGGPVAGDVDPADAAGQALDVVEACAVRWPRRSRWGSRPRLPSTPRPGRRDGSARSTRWRRPTHRSRSGTGSRRRRTLPSWAR